MPLTAQEREMIGILSKDDAAERQLIAIFDRVSAEIHSQRLTEDMLRRQNRMLAYMHRITLDMLDRKNIDDLLQYIVDSATTIMDSAHSEIILVEKDMLVVSAVTDTAMVPKGERVGRGDAKLTWEAVDTRKPVICDNYSAWSGRRSVYEGRNLRAVMNLPILINGECTGVLSIGRVDDPRTYTAEEIEYGMMFSRLAGLVLDYAKLYAAALYEIDQRKRYEQKAMDLALENKRADVLSKFIQHASHEFRTPLSVMQTSLYLMSRVATPEARARKADQIEEQIGRINHLVDMLVIQAAVDSGVTIQKQLISVTTLIRSCADAAGAHLLRHDLTLEMELAEGMPPINGDSEQLCEALDQLLDNAVRYTLPGGKIKIKAYYEKKKIYIEISDNGIGISPEDLPHVFERFYRRDHAHTTPGFGLGLSIANKVIEQHTGTLEVSSIQGEGSIFTVILPSV